MKIFDIDKSTFTSVSEIDFTKNIIVYLNGSCVNQLVQVGEKWGFLELRNPYGCYYYVADTKEASIRALLETAPSKGVHVIDSLEWMSALKSAYNNLGL